MPPKRSLRRWTKKGGMTSWPGVPWIICNAPTARTARVPRSPRRANSTSPSPKNTASSPSGPERPGGRAATFCKEIRSEEHTSELQSHHDLVCRLLLEKKKRIAAAAVGQGFRLVAPAATDDLLLAAQVRVTQQLDLRFFFF